MQGCLGRVTKHSSYYLTDGNVLFLTSDRILFRVHRLFFDRESEFFRDLFSDAAQDDPQSGTNALPFTLDVTSDEFECILWVWYDRHYAYDQQTKDGWLTILRLSRKWGFDKIRELAVREIDALQLSPAEKISIYNSHGIDGERLLSSYVELCRSPRITEADGHFLPMETLIQVLQAREDLQHRARELGHESPTSASLGDEDLRETISRVLGTGLNSRTSGSSAGSEVQAPDLNGEPAHETTARTINDNILRVAGSRQEDAAYERTNTPYEQVISEPLEVEDLQSMERSETTGEISQRSLRRPIPIPSARFTRFRSVDLVYSFIASMIFIALRHV